MMSCNVTMLACLRSFRREISLMAVQGAPSSCSSLISFKVEGMIGIRWLDKTLGYVTLFGTLVLLWSILLKVCDKIICCRESKNC